MFEGVGDQDRERLKELINQLLGVNYLLKETNRERYLLARKFQESLSTYFQFLGWDLIVDDRHECISLMSPRSEHRRRLSREESVWMLVLRLIYQEKRQGLSLSEFPVTTLYDIRSKYEAFHLQFPSSTILRNIVSLCKRYQLLEPLDQDIFSNDCRFRLFHSWLQVIHAEKLEEVHAKIVRYEQEGEDGHHEMDEEVTVD